MTHDQKEMPERLSATANKLLSIPEYESWVIAGDHAMSVCVFSASLGAKYEHERTGSLHFLYLC